MRIRFPQVQDTWSSSWSYRRIVRITPRSSRARDPEARIASKGIGSALVVIEERHGRSEAVQEILATHRTQFASGEEPG
jgi:hypothetical protein